MNFEDWLRSQGIDPVGLEEPTRAIMLKVYDGQKSLLEKAGKEGENAKSRMNLILGTARAATATAVNGHKAEILEYAAELVADDKVSAEDAQKKITEKLSELMKAKGTSETATAHEQQNRAEFAVPADPNAVLSKQEIVSVFGEERSDRAIYNRAAQSVAAHLESGGDFRSLFKDLEGRTGLLRLHVEEGTPHVRTVTASSANVAIQSVLSHLLNLQYNERPPITDAMVTIIPSSANEDTLPEVEAENGVRRIKEGEKYPIMSGSDRDVKVGHMKFGAAIAQTRENSIFDRVGRVTVLLTSMARQLKSRRDMVRLARICDSTALDGRYISRPGNDGGTAAFYSAVADHRGNVNLKASNALADETDINALILVLDAMQLLDESYVTPELKVLLVPSELKATAWKILHSLHAPSATSGQFMIPNPYGPGGLLSALPTVLSHPLVSTYAGASTTWFGGDPSRQFFEKEVWPVEVSPVMSGGDMALRDIINLWKGSFCIDMVALSNMFFVKNTAA